MSLIEKIKARTVEVGDCWEWLGPMPGRVPKISIDGETKAVRRVVYEEVKGVKLKPTTYVTRKCGNWKCVCPDHIKTVGKREFSSLYGGGTKVMTAKQKAFREAHGLRLRKLTEEQVAEIRASTESYKTLGQKYGVSHNAIGNIKRMKSYVPKEVNFWQGLMR